MGVLHSGAGCTRGVGSWGRGVVTPALGGRLGETDPSGPQSNHAARPCPRKESFQYQENGRMVHPVCPVRPPTLAMGGEDRKGTQRVTSSPHAPPPLPAPSTALGSV